jgi:hypothetical protein
MRKRKSKTKDKFCYGVRWFADETDAQQLAANLAKIDVKTRIKNVSGIKRLYTNLHGHLIIKQLDAEDQLKKFPAILEELVKGFTNRVVQMVSDRDFYSRQLDRSKEQLTALQSKKKV